MWTNQYFDLKKKLFKSHLSAFLRNTKSKCVVSKDLSIKISIDGVVIRILMVYILWCTYLWRH